MSYCKIFIVGNLGADPELRHTQNQKAVCNFNLAVNKGKDAQGNAMQPAWWRIVCWEKTADIASRYLRKGSQVFIEGEPEEREWTDQQGQVRKTMEVKCHKLTLIGAPAQQGQQQQQQQYPQQQPAYPQQQQQQYAPPPQQQQYAPPPQQQQYAPPPQQQQQYAPPPQQYAPPPQQAQQYAPPQQQPAAPPPANPGPPRGARPAAPQQPPAMPEQPQFAPDSDVPF